ERTVTEASRRVEGQATIRDVRFPGADGNPVAAYLVGPSTGAPVGAGLFLHWLGPQDSTRKEFLAEAVALSANGIMSLLPQQTFPWGGSASGVDHDRVVLGVQVQNLRRAITVL